MVSEDVYKRYRDKKDRSTEEDEERGTHILLDEIAKMRGYKEKLVGKRKIRPIVQYVDHILEKKYGFKLIKRGEKYYDRKTKEYKIAEKSISPIEQYIDLLNELKIKGYRSAYEYNEWIARQEGL